MRDNSGPDGQLRCRWCGAAPEFLDHHDTEWGFQFGLSWRTILAKRENFHL